MSTEGIIGIVNITVVHKDTRVVNKEDYYILLTVVNGSCDTISPEECEPVQENAIHTESQGEQEPEEPSSTETNCWPKRNRNADSMFFY